MANRIIDDERPILSACSERPDEIHEKVGYPTQNPVTKIEPYHENGEVVWLLVWKGDVIVSRLNAAKMAEIVYQD